MEFRYEVITRSEFIEVYPDWDIVKELGTGVFYHSHIPVIEIISEGKRVIVYPKKEELTYQASYSYNGPDFRPLMFKLKEFDDYGVSLNKNVKYQETAFYKRVLNDKD